MGSGQDWESEEEQAERLKRAAQARENFQRVVMAWFDSGGAGGPITCQRQGYEITVTQEQGPRRLL